MQYTGLHNYICIVASNAQDFNDAVYTYTTGQTGVTWIAIPESFSVSTDRWAVILWDPTTKTSSFIVQEV
jgi:hypothetical protein